MSARAHRTVGIIDIGSNSVRLVIYDVSGLSILPTFNEKVMAGLGEGVMSTGRLAVKGVDAALGALARYRAILRALKVDIHAAVATAAVRSAEDGTDFIKQASRVLGASIRVLSGEDEARLSALGVAANLHEPHGLIGDLGGSSLELKLIGGSDAPGESLMLGPLSLADIAGEPKELRRKVREVLRTSAALRDAVGRFYIVGGSWRSFARLVMEIEGYPLHVLQGYQVNKSQVSKAAKVCVDSLSNPTARATLELIDRRRAKHLPVAAIILEEVLNASAVEGVTVSSAGLREGVLQELGGLSLSDPLLDGVIAFARLDAAQVAFGKALFNFVSPAMVSQLDLFGSPAADARIEQATCMMADSAGRFHPDHRAEMAYDQALRAPYASVSHPERAMIAHAIGRRYEKDFMRPASHVALTTEGQAERARQLGALMRLGAVFSGRSGPILKRATLRRTPDFLELAVAARDRALISDTVERRLAQASSQLRTKPRVVIG